MDLQEVGGSTLVTLVVVNLRHTLNELHAAGHRVTSPAVQGRA
ncbi:hypothetical protein AB0J35_47750 [Nonomuraea angiospora]